MPENCRNEEDLDNNVLEFIWMGMKYKSKNVAYESLNKCMLNFLNNEQKYIDCGNRNLVFLKMLMFSNYAFKLENNCYF